MKVELFYLFVLWSAYVSVIETTKIDHGYSMNFAQYLPKNIFLKGTGNALTNLTGVSKYRIVNGQAAARGQFCYQVYLQFTDGLNYWSCGGSLVTTSKVLTAGHCVKGAKLATVVLGALDLNKYEAGRVVISVPQSFMTVNEDYDENNIYNDIALITLTKAVKLTKYICTAKLPSCVSNNSSSSGSSKYILSGWGKTTDRTLTFHLMYMNVSEESLISCASYFVSHAEYRVTASQMCTSGAGGSSICNGDSGGPLMQVDTSGYMVQQGIVSLGMSSCELGAPSVYTNINYFMSWLCPLIY